MRTITSSAEYNSDIGEFWSYIRERNPDAADAFVGQIDRVVDRLREFPNLGVGCEHLGPGIRRVRWRDYLVYDRVKDDAVELVRLLHAKRDIEPKLF